MFWDQVVKRDITVGIYGDKKWLDKLITDQHFTVEIQTFHSSLFNDFVCVPKK